MLKVLFHCSWIPAEWIRAHGAIPLQLSHLQAINIENNDVRVGTCPYVSQFLADQIHNCDAIVFTTMCDQMRRNIEIATANKPYFLFNLPSTCQTITSGKMYRYELERLGKWLSELTGIVPDKQSLHRELFQSFVARNEFYNWLNSNQPNAETIIPLEQELFKSGKLNDLPQESSPNCNRSSILLVGSPTGIATRPLAELIEKFGGQITIDFTECGWHHLPTKLDQRLLLDDPFEAMVNAYENLPGIFHRPNVNWYCAIRDFIQNVPIKGIIFWQQPWCDLWHGEIQRFKNWSPLPVLALTANDHGQIDAHASGRIEAFMEIINN